MRCTDVGMLSAPPVVGHHIRWNHSSFSFPLNSLFFPFFPCLSVFAEATGTSDGSQCTGSYQTGCNQDGEECLYQATWLVLGERVQFNVSARVDAESWVAIGFSDNMMMVSGWEGGGVTNEDKSRTKLT